MVPVPKAILKLYFPLTVCIALIALMFLLAPLPDLASIPVEFGPFTFSVPAQRVWLLRLILGLGAALSLSFYLFQDYSKLFPQRFKLEVFYDQAGIENAIKELAPCRPTAVTIPEDCAKGRVEYFAQLDHEIRAHIEIPDFFTDSSSVHSEGDTYNVVTKDGVGWQRYHHEVSQGDLKHILQRPGSAPVEFYTKNELEKSSLDSFGLDLKDIFVFRCKLLQSNYRQILLDKTPIYKLRLLGLTKVSLFPWPKISSTVYFVPSEKDAIPVGYARFHFPAEE